MNRAKSALILGHTSSGMGEKTLAHNFKRALEGVGYAVEPVVDILELMGDKFEPFAQINYDLADGDHPIMDDLKETHSFGNTDITLILSWCFSVAALFATGIHKKRPTIANLYAHHPNERILTKLYEPADLLITASLLASERAMTYGIAPEKVLYLPLSYPIECESIKPSRAYVERLAHLQGKPLGKNTQVIGCVGRLEYGKNCEFAVEAVRRLALKGKDVVLVLKGDFPKESPYPDYKPLFSQMLHTYRDEPWLLWDPTPTSFPQVMEEYASFDLLLHPSGAEVASHVAVECLGLKKPVVLLDCSTNPYLFKDLATFVKTTGEMRPALLPFYVPDLEDLCEKLEKELIPPNFSIVSERFHERELQKRIPFLFDRDPAIIKSLYEEDRKHYGIDDTP